MREMAISGSLAASPASIGKTKGGLPEDADARLYIDLPERLNLRRSLLSEQRANQRADQGGGDRGSFGEAPAKPAESAAPPSCHDGIAESEQRVEDRQRAGETRQSDCPPTTSTPMERLWPAVPCE
jgi:hypothetical protein